VGHLHPRGLPQPLGEILIDSTGSVIQSIPELDAAAIECVKTWLFRPAKKDGKPVATIAHAPVSFRVTKKSAGAPEPRKQ
jgi:hypothetical protein